MAKAFKRGDIVEWNPEAGCVGGVIVRKPRAPEATVSATKPLESDAFVFFGATGDLAFRQMFPALQALIRRGLFDMPIIGVARSAIGVDALRARAYDSLTQHGGVDPRTVATLAAHLKYVNGDHHDPDTFQQLRAALGGACRPLYYFAIPPQLFATVADGLTGSHTHHGARVVLIVADGGWHNPNSIAEADHVATP